MITSFDLSWKIGTCIKTLFTTASRSSTEIKQLNTWFSEKHNFSGLNSDTRFNPPLMAFISEPHFSGLNWNPHPVQPRTDTFHLWAQLFGVELRHEVQPPTDGFHLWTSLFRGWTHAHTNQYGIWRQLASINLLSTKQTVGIQTETEPISGSFTLREPKRTQTNQRLTVFLPSLHYSNCKEHRVVLRGSCTRCDAKWRELLTYP